MEAIFGVWDCTPDETRFIIKADFERVLGCSVYALLPGVVENTFGR